MIFMSLSGFILEPSLVQYATLGFQLAPSEIRAPLQREHDSGSLGMVQALPSEAQKDLKTGPVFNLFLVPVFSNFMLELGLPFGVMLEPYASQVRSGAGSIF